MMEERKNWARRLNKLLKTNFRIAKTYRRMMENVTDVPLKNFLGRLASERSQFAMELEQEIADMGESVPTESRNPRRFGSGARPIHLFSNNIILVRNCIKNTKIGIKKYRKALSKINEGSSREKLIRHIASLEKDLRQLKSLKAELPREDNINNNLIQKIE